MKNYRVQDGCWNCTHCRLEDCLGEDSVISLECCTKQKTSENKHHPIDPCGICDFYFKSENES
jgi:hypothetical protein